MTKDFIGYKALTDAALRSVVREALKSVEKQGLIGAHHFRLTFRTRHPGVAIPDFLLEQYPEEMTIILQHQYWGLNVREDGFDVTLTFRKLPATLTIPFGALNAFVDPGVQFALNFQAGPVEDTAHKTTLPTRATAAEKKDRLKPEPEPDKSPEKPPAPAEVVNLDSFRKK